MSVASSMKEMLAGQTLETYARRPVLLSCFMRAMQRMNNGLYKDHVNMAIVACSGWGVTPTHFDTDMVNYVLPIPARLLTFLSTLPDNMPRASGTWQADMYDMRDWLVEKMHAANIAVDMTHMPVDTAALAGRVPREALAEQAAARLGVDAANALVARVFAGDIPARAARLRLGPCPVDDLATWLRVEAVCDDAHARLVAAVLVGTGAK